MTSNVRGFTLAQRRELMKHRLIQLFCLCVSTAFAISLLRIDPVWAVGSLLHIIVVWLLFSISAVSTIVLLCSTSRSMKLMKRSVLCIMSLAVFVSGFQIVIANWFTSRSPLDYMVINPQPMAWLVLMVVTVFGSALLASVGFPYTFLKPALARMGKTPLSVSSLGQHAGANFLANFKESWLACFWIIYLWAGYNLATGQRSVQSWNLWTGWPITSIALVLLFFLSFFVFADVLDIAYAQVAVTLRRYSGNWTLSVSEVLAFSVTMIAILGTNPREYLAFIWLVAAFPSAMSLGFSLAFEALRNLVGVWARDRSWYKLLASRNSQRRKPP